MYRIHACVCHRDYFKYHELLLENAVNLSQPLKKFLIIPSSKYAHKWRGKRQNNKNVLSGVHWEP